MEGIVVADRDEGSKESVRDDDKRSRSELSTAAAMEKKGWKSRILMEPTELRENFEVNVIRCHKAFVREVQMVYPGVDMTGLLAIVTCQKAKYDLCEMGKDIDKEKDDLLESFAAFDGSVVKALKVAGAWADYIDPCSGLPATQDHANRGYSEVDGLAVLLRYSTQSAGFCKVASHPVWGTQFYPATFFTTASFEELRSALRRGFPSREPTDAGA